MTKNRQERIASRKLKAALADCQLPFRDISHDPRTSMMYSEHRLEPRPIPYLSRRPFQHIAFTRLSSLVVLAVAARHAHVIVRTFGQEVATESCFADADAPASGVGSRSKPQSDSFGITMVFLVEHLTHKLK